MKFYADFHIHSRYSRAVSKDLSPETMTAGALEKGILLVGTGDVTHPAWLAELKDKLEPSQDHPGFYALRPGLHDDLLRQRPDLPGGRVLFVLTGEISSIYKKDGKTRKIHNLVFLSSFERADAFGAVLSTMGNLKSDGRPILGLDSREVLKVLLDTDPDGFLVPAHIWTPWFSLLGSKSGFDGVEECFEDLAGEIFALETGLSSDPLMNWRVSGLDRYTLISNSDAHSVSKMGREANIFDLHPSFDAVKRALKREIPGGFLGTVEFFPEEGKYHFDGHRKCGARLHPDRTRSLGGKCPVCGKGVTVGVLSRVIELADRGEAEVETAGRPAYHSTIPLREIIAQVVGAGDATKTVSRAYRAITAAGFTEFFYLLEADEAQLVEGGGRDVAAAVLKMRRGEVEIEEGYDGEFGRIFIPRGSAVKSEQASLFSSEPAGGGDAARAAAVCEGGEAWAGAPPAPDRDELMEAALRERERHVCVIAGPGSGKTRSLVTRIAWLVGEAGAAPSGIAALAFTNKAAQELRERLEAAGVGSAVFVGTIHALCLDMVRCARPGAETRVLSGAEARRLFEEAAEGLLPGGRGRAKAKKRLLSLFEAGRLGEAEEGSPEAGAFAAYGRALAAMGALDYDGMIREAGRLLAADGEARERWRARLRYVHVDEFQDVDPAQVELLKAMADLGAVLFAIGDPEQSIYGFRGGRREFIMRFEEEFAGGRAVLLEDNHRSRAEIVAAGEELLERFYGRSPGRRCRSTRGEGGRVECLAFESDEDEAEYIAMRVRELVGGTGLFSIEEDRGEEAGASFEDMAVLVRSRAVAAAVEGAFRKHGVPYEVRESDFITERPGYDRLVKMLRIRFGIATAFDVLGLLPPGPAAAVMRMVMAGEASGMDGILSALEGRRDGAEAAAFLRRAVGAGEAQDGQDVAAHLEEVAGLCGEWMDEGPGLARSEVEDLGRLLKTLGSDRRRMVDFLASGRLSDLLDVRARSVKVLTMHSAKGLEFNTVFAAGCEDKILPWTFGRQEADPGEEMRLLYVAMTRAREKLVLTHAARRRLWGREIVTGPSAFLRHLEALAPIRTVRKKKAAAPDRKKQLKLF